MKKYFLFFFIIGSIFVSTFGIYKQMYGDPFYNTPFFVPTSKSISDTTAYEMFIDYHKSTAPERSEGVILNKNGPIVYFHLDNETMIQPLKDKAQLLGKEFVGIAAIPAFDKSVDSHTMLWVAVVNTEKDGEVIKELMLPGENERWDSYIYDHTATCPEVCFDNTPQLWNENWQLR